MDAVGRTNATKSTVARRLGDLRALLYLESRYARNNLEAIVRSRTRLVLWSAYALSLVIFAATRFLRANDAPHMTVGADPGILFGVASLYVCSYGIIIALAAEGRVAAFRSGAEATLMLNAGLRPLTIAVWLQMRKIVASLARTFGAFLYAFFVFTPLHANAAATARAFVAMLLVLGLSLSAQLPAFLLARGRAKAPVRIFGWALATCGLVYALAGFGGPYFWRTLLRFTHIDPGLVLAAMLHGAPAAIVVPLLVLAAYVVVVALRGDDALPELYAASNRMQTRSRRNFRDAALSDRESYDGSGRSEHVPAGVGAIVWKEWIALRRGRTALRLWLAGAVLWIVCGVGAAFAARHLHEAMPLLLLSTVAGVVVLYWAPLTASAGLASDLGKPLFWLSVVPLQSRLAAWPFARAWRGGVALGCGLAAALLVLGHPLNALLCVPLSVAAYWSLLALGIGFYAIFPNPFDARGPVAILRLLASVAFLIPASLVAGAARFAHIGSAGVICVLVLGLMVEGWFVIVFVAFRFVESGASLATLARSLRG